MQIYSVTEVLRMQPGTLTGVKGKIKTVGDRNEGQKGKRSWSMQWCIIQDLQNPRDEIKVKIWNREELGKRERGNVIYFTAGVGKKQNDPVGLKLEEDEYRGKTSLLVNFNEEAEWGFGDAHPDGGNARQAPARPAAPPPADTHHQPTNQPARPAPAQPQTTAAAPQQPRQESPPTTKEEWEAKQREAIKKARIFLAQHANLMLLCLEASDYICAEYEKMHPGESPLAPEHFRTMASSLFIDAKKAYLADNMPIGAFHDVLEKLKAAAKQ